MKQPNHKKSTGFLARTGKHFLVFAAALMISGVAMAQPNPDDDPDTPIDGGVSLLVAAGIGYGAKKIHEARKKQKSSVKEVSAD